MSRASRTEAEHIIPANWMLKKNKTERPCALHQNPIKTALGSIARSMAQTLEAHTATTLTIK